MSPSAREATVSPLRCLPKAVSDDPFLKRNPPPGNACKTGHWMLSTCQTRTAHWPAHWPDWYVTASLFTAGSPRRMPPTFWARQAIGRHGQLSLPRLSGPDRCGKSMVGASLRTMTQKALVQRLRNTWCAQFAPPSSPPASLPIRARRITESANARRDFSVSGFRATVRWMEICFH